MPGIEKRSDRHREPGIGYRQRGDGAIERVYREDGRPAHSAEAILSRISTLFEERNAGSFSLRSPEDVRQALSQVEHLQTFLKALPPFLLTQRSQFRRRGEKPRLERLLNLSPQANMQVFQLREQLEAILDALERQAAENRPPVAQEREVPGRRWGRWLRRGFIGAGAALLFSIGGTAAAQEQRPALPPPATGQPADFLAELKGFLSRLDFSSIPDFLNGLAAEAEQLALELGLPPSNPGELEAGTVVAEILRTRELRAADTDRQAVPEPGSIEPIEAPVTGDVYELRRYRLEPAYVQDLRSRLSQPLTEAGLVLITHAWLDASGSVQDFFNFDPQSDFGQDVLTKLRLIAQIRRLGGDAHLEVPMRRDGDQVVLVTPIIRVDRAFTLGNLTFTPGSFIFDDDFNLDEYLIPTPPEVLGFLSEPAVVLVTRQLLNELAADAIVFQGHPARLPDVGSWIAVERNPNTGAIVRINLIGAAYTFYSYQAEARGATIRIRPTPDTQHSPIATVSEAQLVSADALSRDGAATAFLEGMNYSLQNHLVAVQGGDGKVWYLAKTGNPEHPFGWVRSDVIRPPQAVVPDSIPTAEPPAQVSLDRVVADASQSNPDIPANAGALEHIEFQANGSQYVVEIDSQITGFYVTGFDGARFADHAWRLGQPLRPHVRFEFLPLDPTQPRPSGVVEAFNSGSGEPAYWIMRPEYQTSSDGQSQTEVCTVYLSEAFFSGFGDIAGSAVGSAMLAALVVTDAWPGQSSGSPEQWMADTLGGDPGDFVTVHLPAQS